MTTITSEELREDQQTEQAEDQAFDQAENPTKEGSGEQTDDSSREDAGDESEGQHEVAGENAEEDEELSAKYMRLMADFQNFKRRAERERGEIYARANESIVTGLLEVADNFERALADDSAGEDENFRKGMEMIFNQMMDVLSKSGVEEIKAQGEEFDPNYHNAVMMEDTDKVDSGKVSEVLQKGYTLNGRVIRPSMVKVAN